MFCICLLIDSETNSPIKIESKRDVIILLVKGIKSDTLSKVKSLDFIPSSISLQVFKTSFIIFWFICNNTYIHISIWLV